jgi:arginine repressor
VHSGKSDYSYSVPFFNAKVKNAAVSATTTQISRHLKNLHLKKAAIANSPYLSPE